MRKIMYVTGVVAPEQLIVRDDVDPASEKVGHMGNGEMVTVIGEYNGRCLASTGTVGWVSKANLTDKPPDTAVGELPPEPEEQNAKLQWYLHRWGFGPMVGAIDGKVGTKTRAAIKQFQAAMGLTADGIAGTKTWAALRSEIIRPRFTENDLRCTCGKYCDGFPNLCTAGVRILAERLLRELERNHPGEVFAAYVTNNATPSPNGDVAGGQRCERWNELRGGATGSKHLEGMAMDIGVKRDDKDSPELRQELEDIAKAMNVSGGVGYGAKYIVHIDVRGEKARWRY